MATDKSAKALEQAQLSLTYADPQSGSYQNFLTRAENIKELLGASE